MTVAEKMPAAQAEKNTGRDEWIHAVDALMTQVTEWSHLQGWRTVTHEKQIVDETTQQKHEIPVLDIITEREYAGLSREVKLVVEPVTFRSATGTGRVDFYIWPAMYRVRLLQDAHRSEWRVKTDSGIYWPLAWNKETFADIAVGLLGT